MNSIGNLCNYGDALLLEGLAPAEAERLDANRYKLIDLMVRIFRELGKAIQSRDVEAIWQHCVPILVNALLANEIDFLLKYDRAHTEEDCSLCDKSTLTNLLDVIAHFGSEIQVGQMDKTRTALSQFAIIDGIGRPWCPSYYENYFRFNSKEREIRDNAADLYLSLRKGVKEFHIDFFNRLNNVFSNELYDDVVIKKRVKLKWIAKFKPVRHYMNWIESSLNAGISLPDLPLPSAPQPPLTNFYVFQKKKQDEFWTVGDQSKTIQVKDTKGMKYISFLLQRLGNRFM